MNKEMESSVCKFCDKTFSTNSYLKRHVKNVHYISCNNNRKKYLLCPICKYEGKHLNDFKGHVLDVHDIVLKSENHDFVSKSKFEEWKTLLEEKERCCYVKKNGSTKLVDQSVSATFNCIRSGFYTPKVSDDKRKRELKFQGPCKINGYCPSSLKVLFNKDNSVKVLYCFSTRFSTRLFFQQDFRDFFSY